MADHPAGEGDETFRNQADHHKHMDYVQDVITRLANDSFLIKGWALTVTIAVLGYALAQLNWHVALLGLVSPACFWYLDSFFLHRERLFRYLFDDVAAGKVRDFSMEYRAYESKASRFKVFRSETLAWFYGPILVLAVVVLIATATASASPSTPLEDRPEPRPSPGGPSSS